MKKYLTGEKYNIMTREQVRCFDSWAINELGIPGVVLMENAGRSCAELITEKLGNTAKSKVCIFCGTGNNGGDGYVIARHLRNLGFTVGVAICGSRDKIKGDAKINLDVLEKMGQLVEEFNLNDKNIGDRITSFAAGVEIIVDGLFGTGLRGRLSDEYIRLIDSINALNRSVLAVDIPSGLDCDTGELLGTAIKAKWTVTFVAPKGFVLNNDAANYTGEVWLASIGVVPIETNY